MRHSARRLLWMLGPWALVAACGGPAPEPEDMPIDLRDNILEQGIIDCSPYQDTGYVNGSPFAITLVTVDGRPVERDTANAYYVMQQAAARAGVGLRIVSGFRTMAEQEYFYSCYTHCNCNNCNLAARPGYSNHQSGHALDLNTSEGGVLSWLSAHGGDFGFSRTVPSEDWHWEWWGGGPGGGPCVDGDPECLSNASYGGCSGSVITHCDENNRVVSGDCGAYGATCSTAGGRPHCVHFLCGAFLEGGEDGRFCVDDARAGTCVRGAYSEELCDGARRCVQGQCRPLDELDCANGQDDDADGVVDCLDADCAQAADCAGAAQRWQPQAWPLLGAGGDVPDPQVPGPEAAGEHRDAAASGCACRGPGGQASSSLALLLVLLWRGRRALRAGTRS